VPLTVVFEILSPGNTPMETLNKFNFYEESGVEEYYLYDPDTNLFMAFVRHGQVLRRIRPVDGFVSPRLKIRFSLSGSELVVYGPDGQKFLTFEELQVARREAERRAAEAQREAAEAQRRAARLAELSRKARRGQVR